MQAYGFHISQVFSSLRLQFTSVQAHFLAVQCSAVAYWNYTRHCYAMPLIYLILQLLALLRLLLLQLTLIVLQDERLPELRKGAALHILYISQVTCNAEIDCLNSKLILMQFPSSLFHCRWVAVTSVPLPTQALLKYSSQFTLSICHLNMPQALAPTHTHTHIIHLTFTTHTHTHTRQAIMLWNLPSKWARVGTKVIHKLLQLLLLSLLLPGPTAPAWHFVHNL